MRANLFVPRSGSRRYLSLAVAISLACVFSASARAANTWTVTTLTDSNDGSCGGTCSLRDAITAAGAGDTINFQTGLAGTITLGSALPAISASLTIQGPGANNLTVSGAQLYTVFTINSGTVVLSGLTIANGNGTDGGGIFNRGGTLTVSDSTFSGNSSIDGGGIFNGGTLTVSDSTFSDNSAANGGGIFNDTGTLTVNNSTFSSNAASGYYGGGIFNDTGTLTANNNIFYGNSAKGNGGGIANVGTGNASYNVFWQNLVSGSEDDCNGCTSNSNPVDADPMLAPLGNYGGPTETMLPLPGSAAICAGSASLAVANGNPLTTDQRGFPLSPSSCAIGQVDAGSVQSNYLTVNNTGDADDGSCSSTACSLRDALNAAAVDGDIDFASGVTGTITLGSALPQINGQVNLIGPGASTLTVSGGNSAAVGSIFQVNAAAQAFFSGLTIANGNTTASYGGGIFNRGTTAVSNSVLSGNSATYGGAIVAYTGTLSVSGSTFSGNSATAGGGGGIFNFGGSAVTVTNSTFSGNSATGPGGGVGNEGTLVASEDTFSANSAPNGGGGILNYSNGTVTLTNSIFSGNLSASSGAEGAGIFNLTGVINANNNVFYNNLADGVEDDCNNCTANSGAVSADPMLAVLGNYGGSTQTMLPLPGSAVICAGSTSLVPSGVIIDQRGFARTTSYSGTACVDAGAIQTNYQSIQFTNASGGYTGTMNQAVSPAPTISVTENGQNIGAVPVTLAFSGSGTAIGLGPATTVGNTGATFSSLQVNTIGSDTLSATLQITPTYAITTNPTADLTITPMTQTITFSPLPSPVIYGAAPITLSATASSTLAVSLKVDSGPGSITGNTLRITGAGTITVEADQTGDSSYSAATPVMRTIVVNPATLNVVVANASRAYGSANPVFTGSAAGFVNGDTAASTGLAYTTTATPASPRGTYPISAELTNSTAAANYSLNITAGTLTITQVSLTISVNSTSRAFGAANPVFTGSAAGFANGDTAASTGLAYTTTATATSPVGTYPITATLTNTTAAANYSLNITAGTLTITRDTLTISVNSASRAYGAANPVFTGSTSGFVNGDTAASTGLAYTTTATATSPVGTYPITATLTNTTAAANYSLNITAGTLTIARDALTISVNSASRAYGAANPVFTGSAAGFANGDTAASTGLAYTTTATVTSPVGTYPITATLTNTTAAANYSLNITAGTLTITRATLTISANSATRVYGAANPTFSGTVTGAVNGDTFTESFTTTATTASNAGTYAIVPSVTGAKASDYSEISQNGTLTVTQAASSTTLSASGNTINPGQSVTLTAHVQSATANTPSGPTGSVKFYDGTSVLGTATLSGGTATYTTTALASGTTDNLTAVYLGDTNFIGSTSSGTTVSVGQLDFTLSVTGSASQTVTGGNPASYQLGVAPLYGAYAGPVSFAATGLPSGFTATFSPANLAANSGAQTVTVTVQTPMTTAANTARPLSERLAPVAFGLLLLPLTGMRKVRRRLSRHLLVILILLAGLGGVVGLSGCGSPAGIGGGGTTIQPQSYSFTVTASAGNLQHSASLTVEVK